jgi:hypothetical protein
MAIGAILIFAGIAAISPALHTTSQAVNTQSASWLATGMLGNLETWSNGNWHGILALATGTSQQYFLIASTSPYTASSGIETISEATSSYWRYFYITDVYRDTSGNIVTSGGTYDPSTKEVTVVYGWSGGATSTVSEYLTRNQESTYAQIDWSSGPTSTASVSTTNFQFASSTNINYSVPGALMVPLNGIITTVIGTPGGYGYSGDGGPAGSAEFEWPVGIARDSSGNIYIADANANVVREVYASSGLIATIAGNGTAGYTGDGGTATSSELNGPYGVAVDGSGNVYIADTSNNAIRKVAAGTGIITTFAGTSTPGYAGDNGPATSALLRSPYDVAVSGSNVYIADSGNSVIRKVSGGTITTVAGNGTQGYSGDGGPATSAELHSVPSIAVDGSGNLYIIDYENNVVREVTASNGYINTIAGNGSAGYTGDGGPATKAELNKPYKIAVDSYGNLYIADTGNNVVRKVTAGTGVITTVAGNGTASYAGTGVPATTAELDRPYAVAVDASGNLYIVDTQNFVVRKVTYP